MLEKRGTAERNVHRQLNRRPVEAGTSGNDPVEAKNNKPPGGREERGEPAGREVEAPAPGRMHFSALQSSSCGGTPGSLVAMARAAFVALGNFLRPKVPEEDERTFYLTPGRALHSGDHVS